MEKIYQEQGNTLLLSSEEINKLEHMVYLIPFYLLQKQLNEEDFRQRITEFEDKKRRKIQQLQDEVKDKELDGCTFHPEINKAQENAKKRNLEEFLEDQKKFLEKVSKKTEDMQVQRKNEDESIMHPSIDETSRKIIEEKMADRYNKPTHERLYELNKEKIQKHAQQVMNQTQEFKGQSKLEKSKANSS